MCEIFCRTYAHYCSATYNLKHNFPSMPASQLQSADEECAICKEPMKVCVALVVMLVIAVGEAVILMLPCFSLLCLVMHKKGSSSVEGRAAKLWKIHKICLL